MYTNDEQVAIDLETLLNTEPDLSSSFGVRPGPEPYHQASKDRSVEGTNARITLARQPSDIAIPEDGNICNDGYLIARAMLDETVVKTLKLGSKRTPPMRIVSATPTATLLHTSDGAMLEITSAIAWADAMESVLDEEHLRLGTEAEHAARRLISTLKREDDECEARTRQCS